MALARIDEKQLPEVCALDAGGFIDSSKKAGAREHYVKYDAMIASIAIHREATLVTLDTFLLGLKNMPIPIRTPCASAVHRAWPARTQPASKSA